MRKLTHRKRIAHLALHSSWVIGVIALPVVSLPIQDSFAMNEWAYRWASPIPTSLWSRIPLFSATSVVKVCFKLTIWRRISGVLQCDEELWVVLGHEGHSIVYVFELNKRSA